jgi:uncharacterized protein
MVVGLCTVELHIPEAQSLKGKRQVLKSLTARLRNRFNVTVAELDEQDLWQKAILGIACIANEAGVVNRTLDQVLNVIRGNPSIHLLRSHIELL